MKNRIVTSPLFDKRYKRFKKKFPSLEKELIEFLNLIDENPKVGILITDNVYKIRLASADKNSGKSGGFRIITYVVDEITGSTFEIILLIIYDKSEESSFDKNEIKNIIKQLGL
jgi:mRNA-degrading endonuclease RelE of RelBE toxin-antitoxin system